MFSTTLTGMEINRSVIKVARVEKAGGKWRLINCGSETIPENTFDVYYRRKNIKGRKQFLKSLKKALKPGWGKVSRIGLSIPNDIVKLSIQEFADLPSSETEIKKMVLWWARKSVRFPLEDAQITHYPLKCKTGGPKKLLIAVAFMEVIREYETILKELNVDAEAIRPSGINQYNFYSKLIPTDGINAYIGLLSDFFSYLVFEEGQLLFYRAVKRGFSDAHFWQEIEIVMQQYMEEHPDRDIDRLYVGSQVPLDSENEQCLREIIHSEMIHIDTGEIIIPGARLGEKEEPLSNYDAAIGAAQSIL